MLQITIKGIPADAVPDVKEDPNMGFYFELEGIVAEVPPEFSGKQFGPNEAFTFFITTITTIGANVLARFIYDLLKKNQATSVTINNYTINSGNQVEIEQIILKESGCGTDSEANPS